MEADDLLRAGSVQSDEDAKSHYWLISRETPVRLLWVDSARSRACSEQSITFGTHLAHLSAIPAFVAWGRNTKPYSLRDEKMDQTVTKV